MRLLWIASSATLVTLVLGLPASLDEIQKTALAEQSQRIYDGCIETFAASKPEAKNAYQNQARDKYRDKKYGNYVRKENDVNAAVNSQFEEYCRNQAFELTGVEPVRLVTQRTAASKEKQAKLSSAAKDDTTSTSQSSTNLFSQFRQALKPTTLYSGLNRINAAWNRASSSSSSSEPSTPAPFGYRGGSPVVRPVVPIT